MSRYNTCTICGRERLSEPFGMFNHMMKHYRDRLRELNAPLPPRNTTRYEMEKLLLAAERKAKGLQP